MYLITPDYLAGKIQQTELNAITQGVIQNRYTCEGRAQAEILSKLSQRYDFSKEFTSTDAWSPSIAYKAGQRFYLTAAAYINPGVYVLNSLTLFTDGNVYINTTPITVGEAWNPAHWTLLGALNSIYSVNYPNPVFDSRTYYNIGVAVWWRDNNYTSLIRSFTEDQEGILQAGQYRNVFLGTVLPDDPINGAKMWGAGTAYATPAGTLPSNATYYTLGDNRDQVILKHYLDIAIYEMCGGVASQNIPELRKNNWLYAIKCLSAIAKGDENITLPFIMPIQGGTSRSGGKIARQNYF